MRVRYIAEADSLGKPVSASTLRCAVVGDAKPGVPGGIFTPMDLFCDVNQTTRRYGRYVDDLRRLFVFHGLSCGAAEDFAGLAAKLALSHAFRTDLSALCRSIRDTEQGEMSADEMLTVMALASGGEDLVEGRSGSAGFSRGVEMLTMLLSGIGGWRQGEPKGRIFGGEEGVAAESDHREPRTSPQMEFAGGALGGVQAKEAISSWEQGAKSWALDSGPAGISERRSVPAQEVEIAPRPLELALTEMKIYLDEIDRRVGRLEPRVEDIAQIVQTSTEMGQRPQEGAALPEGIGGTRKVEAEQLPVEVSGEVPRREGEAGVMTRALRPTSEEHRTESHEAEQIPRQQMPVGGPQSQDFGGERHKAVEPSRSTAEQAGAFKRTGTSGRIGSRRVPQEPPPAGLAAERLQALKLLLRSAAGNTSGAAARGFYHFARRDRPGMRRGIGVWGGAGALLGITALVLLLRVHHPASPDASVGTDAAEEARQVSKAPVNRAREAANGTGATPSFTPDQAQRSTPAPDAKDVSGGGDLAGKRDATGVSDERASARPSTPSETAAASAKVAGVRATMPAQEPRAEEFPARDEGMRRDEKEAPAVAGELPAEKARGNLHLEPAKEDLPDRGAGQRETGEAEVSGKPLVVAPAVMQRKLISAKEPVYPAAALEQHAQGTVVLDAFITRDGSVRRIDVVNGPEVFVKSAVNAVSWRRYRPYVVQGRPVEVETQITVQYSPH